MRQVHISQVDALFSDGSYAIEFLFYYQRGPDTRRIRRSLRQLASPFWPMFGEYRDGVISFDKYREQECYFEEVSGREFDVRDTMASGFEADSRFSRPDFGRLSFLEAVRFKNGVVLIPKLKHLAGDGYSYFYFLSLLAAVTRPTMVPFKSWLTRLAHRPHHRRTILREFSFKGIRPKASRGDERFTRECNEIPRDRVRSVIEEASAAGRHRISSNDVLSAMAVKRLLTVSGESWGESFRLTMPVDVRPQVPDYGRRFFGNGIMLHRVELKKEEVQNSPVEEIALKIRASMPAVSRETYVTYLAGLEETFAAGKEEDLGVYDPQRGCLVTNLSRLPTGRLDFGTGPPDLVFPLTTGKNAAAILAGKETYVLQLSY